MRALVTGGRGGIGGAIVDDLVGRGYDVVAVDVAPLEETFDSSAAVTHVVADLTDEAAVRTMVGDAAGAGLHVLVNCAGVSPKRGGHAPHITDIDVDEWDRVFAVNVRSAFLTLREAWPALVDNDNASIVNVVSVVAKLAAAGPPGTSFGLTHPAGAHYCASKAALANLTASAARSLAVRGIRCNGVAPGYINSGMRNATDPRIRGHHDHAAPAGSSGHQRRGRRSRGIPRLAGRVVRHGRDHRRGWRLVTRLMRALVGRSE